MPNYIREDSQLALFADNSKLYHTLDTESSTTQLQSDLDCLHTWSSDWNMPFNVSKCKALHFSRKVTGRSDSFTYQLDGQPLKFVPHITDLGITASSDLKLDTAYRRNGSQSKQDPRLNKAHLW